MFSRKRKNGDAPALVRSAQDQLSRRRLASVLFGAGMIAVVSGAAVAAAPARRAKGLASGPLSAKFRILIDRAFNNGDLTVINDIMAEHVIEHQFMMPTDGKGIENMRNDVLSVHKSIKDVVITIEDTIENDDMLWARTLVKGNESTTGKPIVIDCVDIMRFKNGKVVEHWGIPDRYAMLHQSGLLPPNLM